MYNLCKLKTHEYNNSLLGHPIDVVKRSENLDDISAEMIKRIRDGCPQSSLLVMRDVPFEVGYGVKYSEESE